MLALIELWEKSAKRDLPSEWNWFIVATTFIMAAFLSWRKEWIAAGSGFVSIAPSELMALREGRTRVLSDSMLRPYMNKRMRVTGLLRDVSVYPLYGAHAYLKVGEATVVLNVAPWRARLFSPLPVGVEITASGRIANVHYSSIDLKSVEVEQVVDDEKLGPRA